MAAMNAASAAAPDAPAAAAPATPGRLLFVSDMEGCAAQSSKKEAQSRVMCKAEFFASLDAFIASNPYNKVAFLGDYFDQGDGVVESINGMMSLYKKYSGEHVPFNRVHIILGNRDLNKYRFIYEMLPDIKKMSPYGEGGTRWIGPGAWNISAEEKAAAVGTVTGFYDSIAETKTYKERMTAIVSKSMGAGLFPKLAPGLSENQSCYLMLRIMSKPVADAFGAEIKAASGEDCSSVEGTFAEFITNCREMFRVGKVVEYDPTYQTLMSHAGGVSPYFFHNDIYYKRITEGLPPEYYDAMEVVRKRLMEPPNAATELYKEFNSADLLVYNTPAIVCHTLIDGARGPIPPPEYYIIQASSLKPTGPRPFASFVNSCDVDSGCKGPMTHDVDADGLRRFFEQTQTGPRVNVIAHGHVPHCVPVPLIYKREGLPLLFIDNDTSNGYRPLNPATPDGGTVSDLPLAYTTVEGRAVGILSLPPVAGGVAGAFAAAVAAVGGAVGGAGGGAAAASGTPSGKPFTNGFDALLSPPEGWTFSTAPTVTGDRNIDYHNGFMLTFPGRDPAKPRAPAALVAAARRRKTRQRKMSRTRRSRRSRKARRN